MKKLFTSVILLALLFSSCSSDDDNNNSQPNGVFITVNSDTRTPSLTNSSGYEIDLSSFEFNGNFSEPAGIQFVMDIYDIDRMHIGGIGGYTSCVEIELFVDIYKQGFTNNENVSTIFQANSASSSEKQDKAEIFIRLKNEQDDVFLAGTALDNQNIQVSFENGQYNVSFTNLNFLGTNGTTEFTAGARILTN